MINVIEQSQVQLGATHIDTDITFKGGKRQTRYRLALTCILDQFKPNFNIIRRANNKNCTFRPAAILQVAIRNRYSL